MVLETPLVAGTNTEAILSTAAGDYMLLPMSIDDSCNNEVMTADLSRFKTC